MNALVLIIAWTIGAVTIGVLSGAIEDDQPEPTAEG
ncbi:MAG: hypothetical protein ACJAYU_003389 [Bradymonadia bacterium]|jgi:hypothetical protein